jgi:hypothetical protein
MVAFRDNLFQLLVPFCHWGNVGGSPHGDCANSCVSKTPFSLARGGEGVYLSGGGCFHLLKEELGDPVTCFNRKGEFSLIG